MFRHRSSLVVALLAALLTGSAGTHESAHAATHAHPQATHAHAHAAHALTARQLAFHDRMRKLWEDHVTWTRLAIVSFADGSGGFSATAGRLLRNQADIGDAFKPFYGDRGRQPS